MSRRLGALTFVLACAFGANASPPARPNCLAEYRSPEFQVGWSPLILVGAVEEVKEDAQEIKRRAPRNEEGHPPSIARIRILQILKGRYDRSELLIRSGPIQSCAPWDMHYQFLKGEKKIFILPDYPAEGTARLRYGGSVLDCEKMTMVQSRLTWARTFRENYMEEIRQRLPKVHREALDLAREMRTTSAAWPKSDGWPKENAEFAKAKKSVLDRVAGLDVEALRAAGAVDWLEPSPDSWWRSPIWLAVLEEVARERTEDVARAERARLDRDLAHAGVPEEFAGRFRKSIRLHTGRTDLEFPPRSLYADKSDGRDNLTTELILHGHAYDRGHIFAAYGMRFEVLADLDPERVALLIPTFYGSDDEQVHLVAVRAIEQIPGTPFVDLVLRRILDDPWAWSALKHPTDAGQTAARLRALVDHAGKEFGPYGVATFWRKLAKADCFEQPCIDRAVAGLILAKEDLQDSIQEYLQAAMASRRGKAERLSSDEYRKWFATHPASEK